MNGLPDTTRGLKKLNHFTLSGCEKEIVNSDDIDQLTSLNRLIVEIAVRAGDFIILTKMMVLNAVTISDLINITKMRVMKAVVMINSGVGMIDTLTELKS